LILLSPGDRFARQWYIRGVPALGGPIVTRAGLIFVGAASDNYLRAFDSAAGQELWRGRLPGGGQATPMTYEFGHRQFVVIAAGGHGKLGTTRSDTLVAFALSPGPRDFYVGPVELGIGRSSSQYTVPE